MNRNSDTQKTSPNSGKAVSEQNMVSSRNATAEPGKAKTIKVKKGIWRTYDATDGLPGAPHRLLQDRRGYLWISTNAGLCRYDGAEFITYTIDDGLANNDVAVLCEDNQGQLWIDAGRGLSCFDGKKFTNYTVEDGLPGGKVNALCKDGQGRLWIGTGRGLSCFDGTQFTNYTVDDGLLDDRILSLCPGIQGGVWIGTPGGICRFDDEQFMTLTTEISITRGPMMREDKHGRLWIASGPDAKTGIHCFDGKQFKTYTHDDGFVDIQNIVHSVYEDRQGRMWFGAWPGVSCFDGSGFTNYILPGGTFDIIEDREGQIWFAHSKTCGLSCYDAETISLLTDSSAMWTSTQDKKGRIWCGDREVLGIRFDPELSEVEERRISFIGGGIFFMVDSKDQLWISPWQDGLYRYDSSDAAWEAAGGDESSRPRHFGVSDNLADKLYVIPLLEMEDGTIWFNLFTAGRIARFDPDQIPDGNPLESIDAKGSIVPLIEDSRGRLWMGGGVRIGLSCWDGRELVTYTVEDGLPDNYVESLVEDDAGQIWIGTKHGLCCFDGQRFVTYGNEHGLRELYHWQCARDASGQLWFATRAGVYRTDGKHFQWLTEDDGLPSNNTNAVLPQPDGSVIICTNKGIVRYQLTAVLPPPVEIREVVADRVYQNPDEIELTTTAASLLTISYHGLSLASKRMRYSYILEGHDEKWQETWERQARYENLSVGEYTFKVIAINRDLVTSETPAFLKLKIIPDPRDAMLKELQSDLSIKNQQLTFLQREMGRKYQFENIIGKSKEIEWVRNMMDRAIDSGLNVLITGETGTGKELVAKGIHYNSSRKDKLMIPFNCGAASKELINSELFGHRKGAFTGAIEDKMGLFEVATGSTLALDEIGEMPMNVQVNLLRVLQEGEISRTGEHEIRKVDVRIIAITNRDLTEEIKAGRFREDLYYRLNEFNIYVPSLRERREDIPLLAEHFYQEAYREQEKELNGFSPEVMDMLMGYSWPGNVRELQNEINRAYALAEEGSSIQVYHFSPNVTQSESLAQELISRQSGLAEAVELVQRRMVQDALVKSDGNRTKAAEILKMHRPSLVRLMKRLGIE
jgi:DNA-binding NtrC family response regulator/ligand-binding sensor domain-containing protein